METELEEVVMDESRPETRKLIRRKVKWRVGENKVQILDYDPRLIIIPCVKI